MLRKPPNVDDMTMTARDHVLALLEEDGGQLASFRWTATYESEAGSSSRTEKETGVIEAETSKKAFLKLITGYGRGAEDRPLIPYDGDGEVTITVVPV